MNHLSVSEAMQALGAALVSLGTVLCGVQEGLGCQGGKS